MPDTDKPMPNTKLRYLKGWHLRVVCARCGRVAAHDLQDLGKPDLALWEVLLKLRCSGLDRGRLCKGPPRSATLLFGADTARSPRAIREIKVL